MYKDSSRAVSAGVDGLLGLAYKNIAVGMTDTTIASVGWGGDDV